FSLRSDASSEARSPRECARARAPSRFSFVAPADWRIARRQPHHRPLPAKRAFDGNGEHATQFRNPITLFLARRAVAILQVRKLKVAHNSAAKIARRVCLTLLSTE